MKNRKSIITYIVIFNFSMVLVIIIVFAFISLFYANKIKDERYNLTTAMLENASDAFTSELRRLEGLMTLFLDDRSFVLSISDKLDTQFFLEHAAETSKKLMIIKNALPYSQNVFAYSKNAKKIIRHDGGIMGEKDFLDITLKNFPKDFDLQEPKDGLIKGNGYALYIKNLYSHGYVAIQINTSMFANLNQKIDSNFHFFVVDENNRLLVENTSLSLTPTLLETALSSQSITVEGVNYLCMKKTFLPYAYSGLILTNMNAVLTPFRYYSLVNCIVIGILLLSSFFIIYLNVQLYIPLKRFTSKLGITQNGNEIFFIEEKINALLADIYRLSAKADPPAALPEKITLHYLLYGGQQIQESILSPIMEKYKIYHVIVLAVQNELGEGEALLLSSLEEALSQFDIQFFSMDKFLNAIVTCGSYTEILDLLKDLFSRGFENVKVYAGLRANCQNIMELGNEYKLALQSIYICPINQTDFCCGQADEGCIATCNSKHNLSLNSNMLYEHIKSGSYDTVKELMDQALFEQEDQSLGDFIATYKELVKLIERSNNMAKKPVPLSFVMNHLYNPNYIYNCLLSYLEALGEPQEQGDIGNKIIAYVNEHVTTDLSLESVAQVFSITPVYLSSLFKKLSGQTFLLYVSNRRMEMATEILKHTDSIKIYELSKKVGIENTATFIRQFKKYTGTTPDQYRKMQKF